MAEFDRHVRHLMPKAEVAPRQPGSVSARYARPLLVYLARWEAALVSLGRRQARQSQPTTFASIPTRRSFKIRIRQTAEHLDINIVVHKYRRVSGLSSPAIPQSAAWAIPCRFTGDRRKLTLPALTTRLLPPSARAACPEWDTSGGKVGPATGPLTHT
jgi:hypothetical protein